MVARALGCSIVLVLAAAAGAARADPSSVDAASNEWQQAELALFDALRSDSSPRIQVLAGRLYVSGDDAASVLRPKRADVVARAANLAPDDAFVQWMAASMGNYYSSQCGPVHWPETEVAELTGLEPDNAGALLYEVALAQVKGDANAVDDALARMAAAKRADDHVGDEVEAWRKAFLAHPATFAQSAPWVENDGGSPEDAALQSALFKVGSNFSSAGTAVESACKPDDAGDRAWQRLGWCVDAGLLLARKGNSLSLREQGLSLLAASGATPEDLVDLRRGLAWLKANSASVLYNASSYEDTPADRAADWRDAPSEIVATERRLARLGLPLTPPAGWMPSSGDSGESPEVADMKKAWQHYMQSLLEDLSGSTDLHEKALALSTPKINTWLSAGAADSKKESDASTDADHSALVALAAAHPDDALVQWIAAALPGSGKRDATALDRLQRVDGGNAAVWALSFDPATADIDSALQRIAASQRFDDHSADVLGIWFAAVKRHPAPPEVLDSFQQQMDPKRVLSQDDVAVTTAVMFATMGSISAIDYGTLDAACSNKQDSRRTSCAAIGRLLFDGGHTLLTTMIGEMLLRKYDALDADDRARARQIAWWHESSMTVMAGSGDAGSRYVEDTLSTKSEVEALRLAMTRAGKAEPPADWKSAAERRETKHPAK